MEDKMTSWLTSLVQGLVSYPDRISVVKQPEDEQGVLFIVKVADEDTGRIIGRKGSTAEAIRTLVRGAGFLFDMRVAVKFDAPPARVLEN